MNMFELFSHNLILDKNVIFQDNWGIWRHNSVLF